MKEKISVLHLWSNETDARELVRHLAETGFQFEAKLVKTTTEYVSALVRTTYDLIIADENIGWYNPGQDEFSPFEIADEIAPGVPFLLLAGSSSGDLAYTPAKPDYCLEKQHLARLGSKIEEMLRSRGDGLSPRQDEGERTC